MTTPQQRADALLVTWQLLGRQGMKPELRLPVIDALCEIERAKQGILVSRKEREGSAS